MNLKKSAFWIVSSLLLIPSVLAQVVSQNYVSVVDFYAKYSSSIDFFVFFIIFGIGAKIAAEKQWGAGRSADIIAVVVGFVLAMSMALWQLSVGFTLASVGSLSLILLFGAIAFIYRLVHKREKEGKTAHGFGLGFIALLLLALLFLYLIYPQTFWSLKGTIGFGSLSSGESFLALLAVLVVLFLLANSGNTIFDWAKGKKKKDLSSLLLRIVLLALGLWLAWYIWSNYGGPQALAMIAAGLILYIIYYMLKQGGATEGGLFERTPKTPKNSGPGFIERYLDKRRKEKEEKGPGFIARYLERRRERKAEKGAVKGPKKEKKLGFLGKLFNPLDVKIWVKERKRGNVFIYGVDKKIVLGCTVSGGKGFYSCYWNDGISKPDSMGPDEPFEVHAGLMRLRKDEEIKKVRLKVIDEDTRQQGKATFKFTLKRFPPELELISPNSETTEEPDGPLEIKFEVANEHGIPVPLWSLSVLKGKKHKDELRKKGLKDVVRVETDPEKREGSFREEFREDFSDLEPGLYTIVVAGTDPKGRIVGDLADVFWLRVNINHKVEIVQPSKKLQPLRIPLYVSVKFKGKVVKNKGGRMDAFIWSVYPGALRASQMSQIDRKITFIPGEEMDYTFSEDKFTPKRYTIFFQGRDMNNDVIAEDGLVIELFEKEEKPEPIKVVEGPWEEASQAGEPAEERPPTMTAEYSVIQEQGRLGEPKEEPAKKTWKGRLRGLLGSGEEKPKTSIAHKGTVPKEEEETELIKRGLVRKGEGKKEESLEFLKKKEDLEENLKRISTILDRANAVYNSLKEREEKEEQGIAKLIAEMYFKSEGIEGYVSITKTFEGYLLEARQILGEMQNLRYKKSVKEKLKSVDKMLKDLSKKGKGFRIAERKSPTAKNLVEFINIEKNAGALGAASEKEVADFMLGIDIENQKRKIEQLLKAGKLDFAQEEKWSQRLEYLKGEPEMRKQVRARVRKHFLKPLMELYANLIKIKTELWFAEEDWKN